MPRYDCYDDDVYTPPEMAERIVEMLDPQGRLCDPAAGKGAFIDALRKRAANADSFEVKEGSDFLAHEPEDGRWDWIVTNPPWSIWGDFLEKAKSCANNIAFLVPMPKICTNKRIRTMMADGWMLRGLILCDQPIAWGKKRTGFQLVVAHYERGGREPVQAWSPMIERLEPIAA